MSAYFSFKKFITTGFIMVIYILGAIAVTIVSILLMLNSGTNVLGLSGVGVVLGLLLLIFGNLFWRVLCEYLVVQFRIFTELVEINKTLKGGSAAPSAQMVINAQAGPPVCPTCGGPLTYIQQYQRWYCEKERKYV
jgi:hypothetical protein